MNTNALGTCITEINDYTWKINYPGTYNIRFVCYNNLSGRITLLTSITGVGAFTSLSGIYRGNTGINDIGDWTITITVPTWIQVAKNDSSGPTSDGPSFSIQQIPTVAAITQQVTTLNSISAASDSTVSSPSAGQILTYQADNTWKNSTLINPYNTSYARLL